MPDSHTIESTVQGGIQVDFKSCHLWLDTFVQNKNKGVFVLMYPRLFFNRKALWGNDARFEVGASLGELSRRMCLGVTQKISDARSLGLRLALCPSTHRGVISGQFNQKISDSVDMKITEVLDAYVPSKEEAVTKSSVACKII
jgi:intergrase/recombinase